jgi:hypothetical protein
MAEPASKTNDDYWKRAVDALTGYTLADRKTLFDDLKGNHDIPLMYVWVDKNIRPVGTGYVPGFASSGGWHREGEDFLLPFYTMAKHGKGLDHNKAHITFIGAALDDNGKTKYPAGGQYVEAGKWTSKHRKKSDGSHFTWDNSKLAQYSYGSGNALEQIANEPYSTRGFSHSGLNVDDSVAVHLPSFTEVALSFERVNRFLIAQAKVLADWEKRDIGEGSTEWAGSAASLFKHMVHKLNRNYEGYVEHRRGVRRPARAPRHGRHHAPGARRRRLHHLPGTDARRDAAGVPRRRPPAPHRVVAVASPDGLPPPVAAGPPVGCLQAGSRQPDGVRRLRDPRVHVVPGPDRGLQGLRRDRRPADVAQRVGHLEGHRPGSRQPVAEERRRRPR